MERYKNIGGNSGVSGYEIGADFIDVQFNNNSLYKYNGSRPGIGHVEHMKSLALRGHGLNSYISTTIKKNFAAKLR